MTTNDFVIRSEINRIDSVVFIGTTSVCQDKAESCPLGAKLLVVTGGSQQRKRDNRVIVWSTGNFSCANILKQSYNHSQVDNVTM